MADRKTPPAIPRPPHLGDRGEVRRVVTPVHGVVLPEFVEPEATGNYEGEELQSIRERRPTPYRFKKVEQRVDIIDKAFGEFRIEHAKDMGEVKGAIGELVGEVSGLTRAVETSSQREHVTFTAQVDVEKAGQIAQINDTADSRKARRWLAAKVVGAILAVSASSEFMHWIAGRL